METCHPMQAEVMAHQSSEFKALVRPGTRVSVCRAHCPKTQRERGGGRMNVEKWNVSLFSLW